MLTVMKKELKSYLLSPVGYVFIGAFLLIFSVFFYITIYQSSVINFEYLFYNGATILTFVTPVLTMRMFSEERKSKTEQLLLTSPKSLVSIVLGKFLAATIIIIITELFTLVYYAILKYFGQPSLVVALNTLFGFLLLSMAYISFGMFASSITENQIVAVVITIGAFMLMWFLPSLDGIASIINIFSLIDKFDKYPSGLISISEIVTFISFTVLFILLTIITLQRRKSVK